MADEHDTARTSGIWVVATAAGCWMLYEGQELLVPIVFSFVLSGIFRPVVRALQRAKVPAPAGAGIVVLGLIAVLSFSVFMLSGPVQHWVAQAPESFDRAQVKFEALRRPLQRATDAANKLEHAVDGPTVGPTTRAVAAPSVPRGPSLASQFFGNTAKFVSGTLEVLLLLYLLLSTGDLFFRKVLKLAPHWQEKQAAHDIVDEAQSVVMRFVVILFAMNCVLGVLVGVCLWFLGMPNVILWALLTIVLEFIPYLGAAIMIILLSVVSAATFGSFGHILAVPGTYFVISTIQNSVISPFAYGQRLKLNPVAILLSVLFWWFIWGISGAFLAVPIVATIKVIADRTDSLVVLREFLGE
ncbi:AI-2E family transporter [soil metagenome]